MIEAFKNDDVARMVGGRFKLASLIQKRWAQILEGARPLVARYGMTDLEVIVEEIRSGMITWESMNQSPDAIDNDLPIKDAKLDLEKDPKNITAAHADIAAKISSSARPITPSSDTKQKEKSQDKPFKISTKEKVERVAGSGPFSPDRSILL